MITPTVLLRIDNQDEWEHAIVFGPNGFVADRENHKLSALDVLTMLDECGIIDLEREEI